MQWLTGRTKFLSKLIMSCDHRTSRSRPIPTFLVLLISKTYHAYSRSTKLISRINAIKIDDVRSKSSLFVAFLSQPLARTV